MSTPIEDFFSLYDLEKESGIRIDALRKAAREGRLKTVQVGGPTGPHLATMADFQKFREVFRKNSRFRERSSSE